MLDASGKHGVIFAIGFAMMVIIMTIGSLWIFDRMASVAWQVDAANCAKHRHYDESC